MIAQLCPTRNTFVLEPVLSTLALKYVCVCSQAGRAEAEQVLQQALEKVKAELCQAQNNGSTLQAQLQQAQQDGSQLSGQ